MRHWALDQVSVLGAFIAEPSLLYSALAWPDIWHLCFPPACTVVLPLLRSGLPREGEREGAAGISKLPLFSGLRSDGINQLASTSKSFHIQEVSPPGVHCPSFHRLLESAGAKQNQKAPLGSKACLLGNPQLCGFSACSQVIHVLGENSQSRLFGDNRRCQLWSFAPSELGCALNIQPLILLGSYEVATICILWRRKLRLREPVVCPRSSSFRVYVAGKWASSVSLTTWLYLQVSWLSTVSLSGPPALSHAVNGFIFPRPLESMILRPWVDPVTSALLQPKETVFA